MMIAKAIRNRPIGGSVESDFRRRISYVCRSSDVIKTRNLAGSWHNAAFQMGVSASLRPIVRMPSYHIVLSWSKFETPTAEKMVETADQLVHRLGATEHQYVIGLHRAELGHAHIILNRIHPLDGSVLSRSFDYKKLELACRQIEHQHGWPRDRGQFHTELIDGQVKLRPMPKEHWERKTERRARGIRHDARAVEGASRRYALPRLRDALSTATTQAARKIIGTAQTWPMLHTELKKIGLRYALYGVGARIIAIANGAFMRACDLGTDFALPSVQRRIGKFKPMVGVAPIHLPRLAEHERKRAQHITALRTKRTDKRKELIEEQAEERRTLNRTVDGLQPELHQAFRRALCRIHRQERWDFKTHNPLPTRDTLSPATNVAKMVAQVQRFRHVHRAKIEARRSPFSHIPPLDHTACRQLWAIALKQWSSNARTATPDLLMLEDGSALLPRRNSDGQTVGFDKAVPTNETVTVQTISGAELGVVLRGPKNAAACVIATDPSEGLRYSAQHPDQLVIFAAKHLSRRVMTQLRDITQGRKISFIQTSSADPAQDLIMKHLKGAKPIQWENTYNFAPEIEPEAQPAPEAPDDLDDMPGFST